MSIKTYRGELKDIFTNKYRRILVTNKKFYTIFTTALNRAKTNNNRNKVLNKARQYQPKLESISHILRNQGVGYGKPINSPIYSTTPEITRTHFKRNVESFITTGKLNANLAKLNVLIKRLENIEKQVVQGSSRFYNH
jgi:hypothetical protein